MIQRLLFTIFIAFSFCSNGLAQQKTLRKMLEEEFGADTTTFTTEDKRNFTTDLERSVRKLEQQTIKVFKDATDAEAAIDQNDPKIQLSKQYRYNANSTKFTQDQLGTAFSEQTKKDGFTQYLENQKTSKLHFAIYQNPLQNQFPAANVFISYQPTIHKLFFADNITVTVDSADDKLSCKLLDRIEGTWELNYTPLHMVTIDAKKAIYRDSSNFAQLLSGNSKSCKLWTSGKQEPQVIVTTTDGRTMEVRSSKKVSRYTPSALSDFKSYQKALSDLKDSLRYVNSEAEVVQFLLHRLPSNFNLLKEQIQSVYLYQLDTTIAKLQIIYLQKKSFKMSAVISNKDRMTRKIGLRTAISDSNSLVGIVDNEGKWLVTPTYKQLSHNLGAFFEDRVSDSAIPYLYDAASQSLKPSPYTSSLQILGTQNNYDMIKVQDPKSQLFGAVDLNGKEVVPPKYENVQYDQHNRYFAIKADDEDSSYTDFVCDINLQHILLPKYEKMELGKYFITADVKNNERPQIFNNKGKLLTSSWMTTDRGRYAKEPQSALDQELLLINSNYQHVFINNSGVVKLRETKAYSFEANFSYGVAKVRSKNNEKHGFINQQGQVVIPCIYDSAESFIDGAASVSKDGKEFYITQDNEPIASPPFEEQGGSISF